MSFSDACSDTTLISIFLASDKTEEWYDAKLALSSVSLCSCLVMGKGMLSKESSDDYWELGRF
jgi:hypothetical protein